MKLIPFKLIHYLPKFISRNPIESTLHISLPNCGINTGLQKVFIFVGLLSKNGFRPFLPLGGEILEFNPKLESNPELVNQNHYGEDG